MHKVAFELGPLTIHWYGIFVAGGFLLGLWTASKRALHDQVAPETIADLGVWLIIGAIVGARVLYVISYWDESFAGRPFLSVFKVWEGGLVYYGGLIGASLACVLFVRFRKQNLWKIADIMAPSIALGHAIGRIGCLMNGCCYGKPTDLPWAIHFPLDHETHGIGVHPTQIYESILNLILYAGLAWYFRRRQIEGQVFAAYLVGYAVFRSFNEFFRGDYPVYYAGVLTPAHLVSFFVLLAGIFLFWWLRRSEKSVSANRGEELP